jgi:hypothetical protein
MTRRRAPHRRFNAPGETRTPDPLLRRQMLYPAELRAQTRRRVDASARPRVKTLRRRADATTRQRIDALSRGERI